MDRSILQPYHQSADAAAFVVGGKGEFSGGGGDFLSGKEDVRAPGRDGAMNLVSHKVGRLFLASDQAKQTNYGDENCRKFFHIISSHISASKHCTTSAERAAAIFTKVG